MVCIPYILFQLNNVTRLDIVWDVYIPNSLTNKTDLLKLQVEQLTSFERADKQVLSTLSDPVLLSISNMNKAFMEPCSREEDIFKDLASIPHHM